MRHTHGTERWRARDSINEALVNVYRGGAIMVAVIAIIVGVTAAAVAGDLTAGNRIVASEATYIAAGGDLIIARPGNDGSLDASACARVSTVNGVIRSFSLDVEVGAAAIAGRPEVQQTVVTATLPVVDLLHISNMTATDVVASRILADRWSWQVGSIVGLEPSDIERPVVPTGLRTVVAVRDLELLSEGASTGLLTIRPAVGPTQSCFVQVQRAYRDDIIAALPALLAERADQPVQVAPRLPEGRFAQNSAHDFDSRPTRFVGLGAGVVAGFLWTVVMWMRRGRAALYASLGVPWSGGVLIRWGEGVVVTVSGLAWGAILGAVLAKMHGLEGWDVTSIVAGHVFVAVAVDVIVVVVAALWKPAILFALKDR